MMFFNREALSSSQRGGSLRLRRLGLRRLRRLGLRLLGACAATKLGGPPQEGHGRPAWWLSATSSGEETDSRVHVTRGKEEQQEEEDGQEEGEEEEEVG
ncbi:unnamed protein product [Merluccius merluccius]